MSWRALSILLLLTPLVVYGLIAGRPDARRRLARLLRGRSRKWIAAALGRPMTVAATSDIWYYPLDANRRHAIAIWFDRETVATVEVIAPGSSWPSSGRW